VYEQQPNQAIYGFDAAEFHGRDDPITPYDALIRCMIEVSVLFDQSHREI
jgi:hypothetical protein